MALYEKAFKTLVINLQHYYDIAKKAGRNDIMQKFVIQSNKLLESRDSDCKKYRDLWFCHKTQMGKVFLNNGDVKDGLFQYFDALAIGDDIFESGVASQKAAKSRLTGFLSQYI